MITRCSRLRSTFACTQGNLKGYDHTINLVLEGCSERIYSQAKGVEQVSVYVHGFFFVPLAVLDAR